MSKKIKTTIFILLAFSFFAVPVFAQYPELNAENFKNFLDIYRKQLYAELSGTDNKSSIELKPKFPGPNEEVLAVYSTFSFDVNRAEITWTRNGEVVLKGLGEKEYKFVSGSIGKMESLEVRAVDEAGIEYTAAKSFRIGDVDLLWSTDTIIPPEYRGKAMPSYGAKITVTAFPQFFINNTRVSTNSLVYEWSLNGSRNASFSGTGRKTFEFSITASQLGKASQVVALKISNQEKTIVREKTISIPVKESRVLLYEERPLEGPNFARALKEFSMFPGEEKEFHALPYFFSKNGKEKLDYSWVLGGKKLEEEENRRPVLRVILTKEASGIVNISSVVNNLKNALQQAQGILTLQILQ